jgi:hypothetical protein
VGHGGSSWGFRTELVRFVEPSLSIAVSCNADYAKPGELAHRVADHYLAGQLGPESDYKSPDASEQGYGTFHEPPVLTSDELGGFSGRFYSAELDATYHFTVVDSGLMLRIGQELPLNVVPLANDLFEFQFRPQGWSDPQMVSLEFNRNDSGAVTGFGLSSGTERNIVFERYH